MKMKAIKTQKLIAETASLRAQQEFGQVLAEDRAHSEKLARFRRDQKATHRLAEQDFDHARWAVQETLLLRAKMRQQLQAQAMTREKLASKRQQLMAAGREEELWHHLNEKEEIKRRRGQLAREGATLDQLTVLRSIQERRKRPAVSGERQDV